ncbi:DUF305 domain-containing protein [Micromonospora sp. WMMC250]|uniref:DUF305 domain-containing protein n=1 Tax=Micromonospora sp. WMMC250 TaxID=3014781 RepID=UPI0022B67BD7|nr:DUF305 domain-containing protein [Micromonospora sp. WMMC250]MCZ7379836.1 DUF305 domain-containing protein [Micromonospora sp. WMMC250]
MRTIVMRRALLTGVTLSALLASTAACGDDTSGMDHGSGNSPTVTASASAQAAATANDADVMFAQMMIPHHRQAVEMADLAPTRANDPEVKDLAVKIKAAQDPEIVTMTGWLTAWGKPAAAPEGHDMQGMSSPGTSAMAGMADDGQMNELKAAKGSEFDKMFAQMMIAHHNGAIEMAKTEQANGGNPEAKALAAQIEADQAAEVQTLQKILDRL